MRQKDFRKLHGMAQREFARRVGIHEQTAWRYERDGRVPSPEIMQRIMAEFGGEIDLQSYYDNQKNRKGLRRVVEVSCVLSVLLLFSSHASGASYEELIFCSRWYAGVHAVLQASEYAGGYGARMAKAESLDFGIRALAATPESEMSNASKVVAASNDAVNSILANGVESDWKHVHEACEALK